MLRRIFFNILLASIFILSTVQFGFSQANYAPSSNAASLSAGTTIAAQLESTLDAKTAKPGDEVVARATLNVKQGGRVIVHKGDRLVGHVTDVKTAATSHAGSQLGITFDRLMSGSSTTQLNTVVSSLLSSSGGPSGQSSASDDLPVLGPVAMPSGGGGGRSSGGGGGGLLGGVTSGVGSTLGSTTTAAGGLGNTVRGAAGATANSATRAGIATPLKAIQIGSGAQASGQAGTTSEFSTQRGDLRLESGTRMQFRVAAQGGAQTN